MCEAAAFNLSCAVASSTFTGPARGSRCPLNRNASAICHGATLADSTLPWVSCCAAPCCFPFLQLPYPPP